MQIITKKKQEELDAMAIKKLRFVARATLENFHLRPYVREDDIKHNEMELKKVQDNAEQVFYSDDVI